MGPVTRFIHRLLVLFYGLAFLLEAHAIAAAVAAVPRGAVPAADSEGRALLQAAAPIVRAYHEGHRDAENVLRVVYFHPRDRDPLPDYAARLDRALNDISDFYRDGLARFGIETDGLPLERVDGHVVLHVVRGQKKAASYGPDTSNETIAEVRAALKPKFDLDREVVLILYGLSVRQKDGSYLINSPYFGDGTSNQRRGLCHAVDCELLDPLRLTDTTHSMVRNEHTNPRMEQSVAGFNTWYLGGIAHELGHALGMVNHDAGAPDEAQFGHSLMGAGNLTYRQDVWSGGKPAFLSRVTALQLLSHPFFTGSNAGRWAAVEPQLQGVTFGAAGRDLDIQGTIRAAIPAYAVVASVWPLRGDEHDCQSYPALVHNGRFVVRITGQHPERYYLRLTTLHVNGATNSDQTEFAFDSAGTPDAAALNTRWLIRHAEVAVARRDAASTEYCTEESIQRAPTPIARQQLRVLRDVVHPPAPFDLGLVSSDQVFLSDASWTDAKVGWGQPARNHAWFDEQIQDGVFLTIGGDFYEKGLYAHAPSRYAYSLGGKWRTFTATIGVRDGADPDVGTAVFVVRGDGRTLYRSPRLKVGAREDIRVDVSGVKTLELVTDSGWEHNFYSWSIWADPLLKRYLGAQSPPDFLQK